jgi:hypothetical protein
MLYKFVGREAVSVTTESSLNAKKNFSTNYTSKASTMKPILPQDGADYTRMEGEKMNSW